MDDIVSHIILNYVSNLTCFWSYRGISQDMLICGKTVSGFKPELAFAGVWRRILAGRQHRLTATAPDQHAALEHILSQVGTRFVRLAGGRA